MPIDPIWNEIAKKYGPFPFREIRKLGMSERWVDYERYLDRWDIPDEVIIGTAGVGNFVDLKQNPRQPVSLQELTRQLNACIDLGSAVVHVHARDETGQPCEAGPADKALKIFHAVLDPVKKHAPNVVVEGGAGYYYGEKYEDSITTLQDGLFEIAHLHPLPGMLGDNVNYYSPKFDPQAMAEYCEKKGIKPCIDVHDTNNILAAKKWLIEPGIVSRPTFWDIVGPQPGGFIFMPNVRSMIEGLLYMVDQIRAVDPEAVIYVINGGRATFYIVVLAMMMGLHVRVGMEDTIWKYPHKDEKLETNIETVKQCVEVAKYLGRKPATPDDCRRILGLR